MRDLQEKKNKSQKHETIGRILQTRKDGELKSEPLKKGQMNDMEPPRMATSYSRPLNSNFVGESQLLQGKRIKPINTKDKSFYYHTEDMKQPNSTSSFFRTYGHPNSDLVEGSQLLQGDKIKPINTKERRRHADLKEPQSTGSYLRTKGTLKSHFAEESKIEAKEKPITMKASGHNYTTNELKQPHTASSYFRTQRAQTKLHYDYDRLYKNTGDPQIGPSLKSVRTKPKENDKNYSHKIEGGQAKTPSSASSLLRKITASLTHGNTKATPSHKQSNKYERHQSNESEKSSISSSNYSIIIGSEKYSTSSSKYGIMGGGINRKNCACDSKIYLKLSDLLCWIIFTEKTCILQKTIQDKMNLILIWEIICQN
ncbi:unnamed protein product [Meloidogyne enterolobii]|uniref:Uncharacterized protein n=1 Tax=Meloidogyne enterolobii TaxID=390850 RepID=A0ACB1AG79_MELEN